MGQQLNWHNGEHLWQVKNLKEWLRLQEGHKSGTFLYELYLFQNNIVQSQTQLKKTKTHNI